MFDAIAETGPKFGPEPVISRSSLSHPLPLRHDRFVLAVVVAGGEGLHRQFRGWQRPLRYMDPVLSASGSGYKARRGEAGSNNDRFKTTRRDERNALIKRGTGHAVPFAIGSRWYFAVALRKRAYSVSCAAVPFRLRANGRHARDNRWGQRDRQRHRGGPFPFVGQWTKIRQ